MKGGDLHSALMAVAIASLVLAFANGGLSLWNRSTQTGLAQRQETLAQGPQLARVAQLVVTTIAETAQRNNDDALKKLLSTNGITLRTPQAAEAPATAAPPAHTP